MFSAVSIVDFEQVNVNWLPKVSLRFELEFILICDVLIHSMLIKLCCGGSL